MARSNSKRLQVAETVSLGEKRFVSVIKVDGREFLIGGGATNITLLAQLGAKRPLKIKKPLNGILAEKMTVSSKQPAKRARKKVAKPTAEKPGRQS
jgi:flagellar biogenesis protein FliO